MIKKVCLLAATFLLAACSPIATLNQVQVSTAPPTSTNSTSPVLTQSSVAEVVQCDGEIPASLKAKLGKYRLAQKSDFVPAIRAYEQENLETLLVASSRLTSMKIISKTTRCYWWLRITQRFISQFCSIKAMVRLFLYRLKLSRASQIQRSAVIYTSMSFKPPKSPDPALREYFPLKPETPERKIFEAKPAIELWRAIATDLAGVPQNLQQFSDN